jgi:hypothetical protein
MHILTYTYIYVSEMRQAAASLSALKPVTTKNKRAAANLCGIPPSYLRAAKRAASSMDGVVPFYTGGVKRTAASLGGGIPLPYMGVMNYQRTAASLRGFGPSYGQSAYPGFPPGFPPHPGFNHPPSSTSTNRYVSVHLCICAYACVCVCGMLSTEASLLHDTSPLTQQHQYPFSY